MERMKVASNRTKIARMLRVYFNFAIDLFACQMRVYKIAGKIRLFIKPGGACGG